jgi:Immunoglobulin-like domain of bacterial spore germination
MSQITPTPGGGRADGQPAGPSGETPPTSATDTEERPDTPTRELRRPTGLMVALAVALAVIAALVGVLLWPDDTDDVATGPSTTLAPTTAVPPTTEPATTAPTTATTVAPAPTDTSTAMFPYASSDVRFDDPVNAARGFAVDFVGFTDPVVGGFMQGDARSGEVEVRPMVNGPVTTVFVRQLGTDGTWWVLGSATANIAADAPGAGEAISSPVSVSGNALAYEGTVNVEIRQDGAARPLGTGVVTGGGDILRPFSGEIGFSAPTEQHGAAVFLTHSEEDGRVWEAAVVRVSFG